MRADYMHVDAIEGPLIIRISEPGTGRQIYKGSISLSLAWKLVFQILQFCRSESGGDHEALETIVSSRNLKPEEPGSE